MDLSVSEHAMEYRICCVTLSVIAASAYVLGKVLFKDLSSIISG